ncbi:hypothetical protein LWI29_022081 [Acer saccharum]|uniref:Uncharacterized protein n=1 Tax=Acer saccharum TaxID=4024 RepID=A0AA39W6R5_ACESA|nr:hypothetical protein LWI29_022081 [Acer saccharum]
MGGFSDSGSDGERSGEPTVNNSDSDRAEYTPIVLLSRPNSLQTFSSPDCLCLSQLVGRPLFRRLFPYPPSSPVSTVFFHICLFQGIGPGRVV